MDLLSVYGLNSQPSMSLGVKHEVKISIQRAADEAIEFAEKEGDADGMEKTIFSLRILEALRNAKERLSKVSLWTSAEEIRRIGDEALDEFSALRDVFEIKTSAIKEEIKATNRRIDELEARITNRSLQRENFSPASKNHQNMIDTAKKSALLKGSLLPDEKQSGYQQNIEKRIGQIWAATEKMEAKKEPNEEIKVSLQVLLKDFHAATMSFVDKHEASSCPLSLAESKGRNVKDQVAHGKERIFTVNEFKYFEDDFVDDTASVEPREGENRCALSSEKSKIKKCPNALILTANPEADPENIALNFVLNQPTLPSFKKIEKSFNTKYENISNAFRLCQAIDREKANGTPVKLLIIRGHGKRFGLSLGKPADFELSLNTQFPKDSCLHNLAPKATVILYSCSTGQMGAERMNLANHIALNSPKDATIFAPRVPISYFIISRLNPLDIKFCIEPLLRTFRDPQLDAEHKTYKIDSNNRKELEARFDPPIFKTLSKKARQF